MGPQAEEEEPHTKGMGPQAEGYKALEGWPHVAVGLQKLQRERSQAIGATDFAV